MLNRGEGAALRVIVVGIRTAADNQFAFVRLADVSVHSVRHYNDIKTRFEWFGHARLQRKALKGQAQSRHLGDLTRMSRGDDGDFVCTDVTALGFDAGNLVALAADSRNRTVLYDVNAAPGSAAGISPCNGVMACGSAAGLIQCAEDGIARLSRAVQQGNELFNPGGCEHLHVQAFVASGIGMAAHGANVMFGLAEHQESPGREHRVEIQFGAEVFVKGTCEFVDGDGIVAEIVGADDRGISSGIAAAEPAFFQHDDVGEIVVFGEVVGGGKAVAAGTDNGNVIGGPGFGGTPCGFPVFVVVEGAVEKGEEGIFLHGVNVNGRLGTPQVN